GSDASRGRLYLEFARSRLAEAAKVDPSRLGDVLADMNAETREGVRILLTAAVSDVDPSTLSSVDTFVTQQQADLLRLTDPSPSVSSDRTVTGSTDLLRDVSRRLGDVRNAISHHCPIQSVDNLGPKPASDC